MSYLGYSTEGGGALRPPSGQWRAKLRPSQSITIRVLFRSPNPEYITEISDHASGCCSVLKMGLNSLPLPTAIHLRQAVYQILLNSDFVVPLEMGSVNNPTPGLRDGPNLTFLPSRLLANHNPEWLLPAVSIGYGDRKFLDSHPFLFLGFLPILTP